MLNVLRAELERLFDLAELTDIAARHLDVDPAELQGWQVKGAAADTIVERARQLDAVEALADVVMFARPGADRRLDELSRYGHRAADEPSVGVHVGPWLLQAVLGRSPAATVYAASRGDDMLRVRVLRPAAMVDRSAVERYLVATRLSGDTGEPGLPNDVVVFRDERIVAVAAGLSSAESLSGQLGTPWKPRKAWSILRSILESLGALHRRRLVHGAIHPDNVLVGGEPQALSAVLLDAGTHHLRTRQLVGGASARRGPHGPLAYAAPEQLLGEPPTPRSDVYSFGLLLYALLAGRPAYGGTGQALLKARFTHTPEPLSLVAPRGWILPDFDEIVRSLLQEDPEQRPPDAEAVFEMLEGVAAQSVRRTDAFPEDALDAQLQSLFDNPADDLVASLLEESVGRGAHPGRVAEAFVMAAEQLRGEPSAQAARRRLLTRAGLLYDGPTENPRAAAQAYRALLEIDRSDETVLASLERAYRRAGDYQGLVELLVEHAQQTPPGESKARVLARVGDLLATKLGDTEQAVVAYAHAFLNDPTDPSHAQAVERLAGTDKRIWTEVLEVCTREVIVIRSPAEKNQRLIVMGGWYRDHVSRMDVALQCFQAIVMTDPAHDAALEAMADLCRQAGQWRELAELLLSRARVAPGPAQSRDLRAEAASVLQRYLSDGAHALDIYEQILQEDPSHGPAGRALCELHMQAGRFDDYVRVMRRRVEAAPATGRARLLCELAEAHEQRKLLNDAVVLYEQAASDGPSDQHVLRKLDDAYTALRRPEELLGNLDKQLALAVTPGQKTALLQRMAVLNEVEFLDKKGAIVALERIVEVEPGHLAALESLGRLYRDLKQWDTLAWTLERHAAHLDEVDARADKLLELGALAAGPLHEPAFAIDAYERALLLRPDSSQALDALASLRATEGDEAGAAEALEALADTEADPARRADYYVRAADILSLRGEHIRAIERYKRALDAVPSHARAAIGLHGAYLANNDVELAVRCLEAAIPTMDRAQDKANLSAELARTLASRTDNLARAEAAAAFAVEFDPDHVPALVLLADLDRRAGRYEAACARYAAVEGSIRGLADKAAASALCGYAECLARVAQPQRALSVLRNALERDDGRQTLLAAGQVAFVAEDFPSSVEFNSRLVQEHGRTLEPTQLAEVLWRRGESLRREGRLEEAIAPLERAAELDLQGVEPLRALAAIYRAREQWLDLSKTMVRMLSKVQGDLRVELLLEIGQLAEDELDDRATAGRCYAAALAERPSDRKLLLKLAEFHRAERDWARLVDAIAKLADLSEEPAQKARYLRTAAGLASQEMLDQAKAAELLDRAVAQDPSDESIVAEAIALKHKMGDNEGLELLYQRQIREAFRRNELPRARQLAGELAQLHMSCGRDDDAVAVLEASLEAGGEDPDRESLLLELYAKDAVRYLDRAVRFARSMVARAPRDPQPYRILRRMYADAKRRDATWVACQALTLLGAAEQAEARYFEQYRDTGPIPEQARLSERDWAELLVHPDADDDLTLIFRVLQPVLAKARARSLHDLGFSRRSALDPAACPGTLVESLAVASRMLGVPMPLLFENPRPGHALTMAPCEQPILLLAPSVIRSRLPRPRAAFVAATHLAYLRSGFYVRSFVPKLALKAWLLAAVRVTAGATPADPEVEGLTRDTQKILEANLAGSTRDHLAAPVHALLKRGGRLSIGAWMDAVDLTSDRAGFVVCGQLRPAISVIEESAGGAGLLPAEQRVRALLQYSVSAPYLTLRDRLRLSVDWVHTEELPLDGPQPSP